MESQAVVKDNTTGGHGHGNGFALVKFSVEYLAPLFFPGSVEIGTMVTRIGSTSYNLGQGIFDGEIWVATAEVVTVFFDPKNNKSQKLTDELRIILGDAMTAE